MSVEGNKALIRSFYDAVSGKDKSKEELVQFIANQELIQEGLAIESAFPKFEVYIDSMIGEDDKVCILARFRGVHKGDLAGIPPTGKQVELNFCTFYWLADGKIIESREFMDQMSMMTQLGVIPG